MTEFCPFCGSIRTNKGFLKLYGPYNGYKCRSWFADNGKNKRSKECHDLELKNKVDEHKKVISIELESWEYVIQKLVSECRRIISLEKMNKKIGGRLHASNVKYRFIDNTIFGG